jgi:hypothetical protein
MYRICGISLALQAVSCAHGGRTGAAETATLQQGFERDAVVSTAGISEDPWTCPGQATRVDKVSYARYRLTGCEHVVDYECNFAFQPPRCWRK